METWQVQRRYEWYEAKEEELQEGPPSGCDRYAPHVSVTVRVSALKTPLAVATTSI